MCTGAERRDRYLEVGGHGLVVLVVGRERVPVGQPHAARARLQPARLAQVAPRELALACDTTRLDVCLV